MNRPFSHFSIIVSYIFLFYKIFSLYFHLFCISFSFSFFYLIAILHNFYYVFTVFFLLFSQLFISLLLFFIITQKRPRGLNHFRPSGSIFTFGHNSCFHMTLLSQGNLFHSVSGQSFHSLDILLIFFLLYSQSSKYYQNFTLTFALILPFITLLF